MTELELQLRKVSMDCPVPTPAVSEVTRAASQVKRRRGRRRVGAGALLIVVVVSLVVLVAVRRTSDLRPVGAQNCVKVSDADPVNGQPAKWDSDARQSVIAIVQQELGVAPQGFGAACDDVELTLSYEGYDVQVRQAHASPDILDLNTQATGDPSQPTSRSERVAIDGLPSDYSGTVDRNTGSASIWIVQHGDHQAVLSAVEISVPSGPISTGSPPADLVDRLTALDLRVAREGPLRPS